MVIIGREIAVSVLRIIGVSQGVSIPADKYGKLKTVLQIVYVVYVLFPTADIAELIHVSTDVAVIIQWVLAVVVVIVTLASGVQLLHERPRRHPHAGEPATLMPPGSAARRRRPQRQRAARRPHARHQRRLRLRRPQRARRQGHRAAHGRRRRASGSTAALRARPGRRARPARRRRRARHHARRPHGRVPRARSSASPLEEDPAALACVEERVRAVAERRHLDFDEAVRAGAPPGACCRPAPLPCRRPASRPASPRARGPTRIFAYPGRALRSSSRCGAATAGGLEREGVLPGRRRARRPRVRRRRAAGGADPRRGCRTTCSSSASTSAGER